MRLSARVRIFIDSFYDSLKSGLPPDERMEEEIAQEMFEHLADDIVSSREMMTASWSAVVEKQFGAAPDFIEDILDERFTANVVREVPGYVKRTLQFSRLTDCHPPSEMTNSYLREAIRTYIFGLAQASVALSRAALEQALKENLGYQGTSTFIEMNKLLDEAEGAQIIDKTIRQMAREIANQADDVLHAKPTELPKAFEVLLKLRGVLEHVYAV